MQAAKSAKRNRGSALLTALFIMTLVAIVATAMSTKVQLDIYRTKLVVNHDALYLASQAVTFWAMGELDKKTNQFTKVDQQGMVSKFPKNLTNIYPNVSLNGGLYDLQGRFNLNNLVDRKTLIGFINLLNYLMPKLSEQDKIHRALAVSDWLSPFDLARGKDNYANYYLSQNPPYYPSHQLMSSSSEFRSIKDVSAANFLALAPFITALPEQTPVNINTAPKQVLMSLGNAMTDEHADKIIEARGEEGIKDIKKIDKILKKFDLPNDQITIESRYFLNVAYATANDQTLVVYSLLKRNRDKKGKISVTILRESFNIF